MKLSPSSTLFFGYVAGIIVIAAIFALIFGVWLVALGLGLLLVVLGAVMFYRWSRSGEIERLRDRDKGRSY